MTKKVTSYPLPAHKPSQANPPPAIPSGSAPTPASLVRIAKLMREVEVVVSQYFPEALDVLKAALAVVAVGCIADNQQPTTLVLVAPSGAGKSMSLNFLTPDDKDDDLKAHIYRSDAFTP